jgi:polysaccharide deacetylase family protein (PEP-CTERM system associated)
MMTSERKTPRPDPIRNAITIDVEDYFQVEAFRSSVGFGDWGNHELRVERSLVRLLEMLELNNVKSTFFVLGWIAERVPGIVQEIRNCGHEIACHSYSHNMISDQTKKEFREDTCRAKATLENIVGEKIVGYRAPTFSITEKTMWALDILAEEGFLYDSSIFPVRHDRYGVPDWHRHITTVELGNGCTIIEVPPLTVRILGFNFPMAGGGYFRLAPFRITAWALRRMNAEGHPAILYLHPWEIDPDQPRIPAPPLSRFRHYANLAHTEGKLQRLLASGSYARLKDVLSL